MRIIGMIGYAVVTVIGLLMMTEFWSGTLVHPPFLSGAAFFILGGLGLWKQLP